MNIDLKCRKKNKLNNSQTLGKTAAHSKSIVLELSLGLSKVSNVSVASTIRLNAMNVTFTRAALRTHTHIAHTDRAIRIHSSNERCVKRKHKKNRERQL